MSGWLAAAECCRAAVWAAALCAVAMGGVLLTVLPRDREGAGAGVAAGAALGAFAAAAWGACGSVRSRMTRGSSMRKRWWVRSGLATALAAAAEGVVLAQGTSPWVQAVNNLQQAFTEPIARGLALVAIVVGGLMFAFQEGGSKQALAGIIFGLGVALGAANFIAWLF